MGFFSRLFGFSNEASEIKDIASEVDRYADRFKNSKDRKNSALARDYANRIRHCAKLKQAKSFRAEFLAIVAKYEPQQQSNKEYQRDLNEDIVGETFSDDS